MSILINVLFCRDFLFFMKMNIMIVINRSFYIDLVLLEKILMCIFIFNLIKGMVIIEMIEKWEESYYLILIFDLYEAMWLIFFWLC